MIRGGIGSDSPAMGKVYCEAWRTAYRGIVSEEFLNELTPETAAPPPESISQDNTLVCVEDGRVVGLVNFGQGRDADGYELRSIYVLPGYWRKGVGRRLFTAAAEVIEAAGNAGFYLWVLTDNARARRFYESMGMQPVGRRVTEIAGRELPETCYSLIFRI